MDQLTGVRMGVALPWPVAGALRINRPGFHYGLGVVRFGRDGVSLEGDRRGMAHLIHALLTVAEKQRLAPTVGRREAGELRRECARVALLIGHYADVRIPEQATVEAWARVSEKGGLRWQIA